MGTDTDTKRTGNRQRAFRAICTLVCASTIFSFVDMYFVVISIREEVIAFANFFVAAATIASTLLRIKISVLGYSLAKKAKGDTSDLINRCQSLAIAAGGLCVVDWIVDSLADNSVNAGGLAETLAILLLIVAYYRMVSKMERSTFWDGIKTEVQLTPYLPVGGIATEYVLDEDDGMLRPAGPGETANVSVLTPEEFIRRVPVRIVQQVIHSLKDVRRSSCLQLGNVVIGNVRISVEVQRASGIDASRSIAFSYLFMDGRLVLGMPEDSPERSFFTQAIVDQFIDKTSALSFLTEMVVMPSARISNWIREYEERLLRLETHMNDEVYEMPVGLSEFITNARRELGAIQSFCRQTGDMLEDLTEVAKNGGYERAAMQCAVVSRQIARLALDAEDVCDLAGEIRSGHLERIELRQNNVMSLLTIVETVFTPLALVTGWYGMNFVNMPELQHPDAYFIVAGMLIFLIALEFSLFKRRRWF